MRLAGLIYALTFLVRDEYSVESLLEGHRVNSRLFLVWNLAFVTLAAIGFLDKEHGGILARLAAVVLLRRACHCHRPERRSAAQSWRRLIERGVVRRRKLMIVGTEDDVARLEREISDGSASVYVAARAIVPDTRP